MQQVPGFAAAAPQSGTRDFPAQSPGTRGRHWILVRPTGYWRTQPTPSVADGIPTRERGNEGFPERAAFGLKKVRLFRAFSLLPGGMERVAADGVFADFLTRRRFGFFFGTMVAHLVAFEACHSKKPKSSLKSKKPWFVDPGWPAFEIPISTLLGAGPGPSTRPPKKAAVRLTPSSKEAAVLNPWPRPS